MISKSSLRLQNTDFVDWSLGPPRTIFEIKITPKITIGMTLAFPTIIERKFTAAIHLAMFFRDGAVEGNIRSVDINEYAG